LSYSSGHDTPRHRLGTPKVRTSSVLRTAPRVIREISRERQRPILPAPHKPDPRGWPESGLHVAWLGHSTVLLKIDGFTIITDPVFSDRVGIEIGPITVGIKRLVAPALHARQSVHPDLILLSHAHMDHFDRPSLRALESPATSVVTAARTSDLLRFNKYAVVHELSWNGEVRFGRTTIRAFEVNHWGARMRTDTYRGFNGYVIESESYRIVFGGDTAFTHTFRHARGVRPVDLAIMPIGAYDPWIRYHCNPEQAWQMAQDAGAEYVLPVHHQTFQLSRESYWEPIERLVRAAGANPQRVCLHEIGQEFHL
jgi:L-ascorbate metabolism protein UlaG (beta-lactamase superfamily)